jgi:CRP-like cAMP-binding protein
LFPPHRTAFDARAIDSTHTVMFDGACLRRKCDADPALGYDLHRLFAHLVIQRLQHTLLQLADVYGTVAGS